MKNLIIALALIAILSVPAVSFAGDSWSKQDKILEWLSQGTLFLDYAQTMSIAKHPERWHEVNPILGQHPSPLKVTAYFATAMALHIGLTEALPERMRPWFQGGTIVLELGCVANNLKLGIGFRW